MWREIADQVFVRRFVRLQRHVGLIVGDRGLAGVDTRGSERQGRELPDEIRWVTPASAGRGNTHHHYDHAFGNCIAFVPYEMWGHERCAARAARGRPTTQFALAAAMPEVAQEYMETPHNAADKTFREACELELGNRQVS